MVRLTAGWTQNKQGLAGMAIGALVWALSAVALGYAMQANLAVDERIRLHDSEGTSTLIRQLHGASVLCGLGFTVLQLAAILLLAFVLRACYRLRSAVCFAAGTGLVMAGDMFALLGLLVWIGVTVGGR